MPNTEGPDFVNSLQKLVMKSCPGNGALASECYCTENAFGSNFFVVHHSLSVVKNSDNRSY